MLRFQICFWLHFVNVLIILLLSVSIASRKEASKNVCHLQSYIWPILDERTSSSICPAEAVTKLKRAVYLMYHINPPEGFNLRRDVYIRLAVLLHRLANRNSSIWLSNVRLVLPTWRRLYHWKTSGLYQEDLPWHFFFDVESLKRYAPVMDFDEFLEEISQLGRPGEPDDVFVDKIFQLLHFEDMFENGVFHDKFEVEPICPHDKLAPQSRDFLSQHANLLLGEYECLHFQGSAALLQHLLSQTLQRMAIASGDVNEPRVIALLNAEIVLHDHWADREFWRARRSMRFASHLMAIADAFRKQHGLIDEQPENEQLQRPPMWEAERPTRKARGGPYLCAHLRRGDFIYGRERQAPTLKSVELQLKHYAQSLNLTTIFLATDANAWEVKQLRASMPRLRIIRYACESLEQKRRIKDGGVAIVDQIICSYGRYFVGTYESTFTYRIYEEREILGFPPESTFNTLCQWPPGVTDEWIPRRASTDTNDRASCLKNANWPIVY